MQLPDTENIHFQHAFKKGYRMALDGKSATSMPSDIRRDIQLRDYFQQGWQQALEQVNLAQEINSKPNWKQRFIWISFMLLAGLATAMLMISNIEKEIAEQQAIIDGPTAKSIVQTSQIKPTIQIKSITTAQDLSLLSDAQRSDLQQTYQQSIKQTLVLEPVQTSNHTVTNAVLSQSIMNVQAVNSFNDNIPKYVRELFFSHKVEEPFQQTIYHRWRTDTEILATIEANTSENSSLIWTSKKMSSAWQGQWYIEVLDSDKKVIERITFNYGVK